MQIPSPCPLALQPATLLGKGHGGASAQVLTSCGLTPVGWTTCGWGAAAAKICSPKFDWLRHYFELQLDGDDALLPSGHAGASL